MHMDRAGMKAQAKHTLRKHYWLLVVICLFATFLGVEYGSSGWSVSYQDTTVPSSNAAEADAQVADSSLQSIIEDLVSNDESAARNEVKQRQDDIHANDTIAALGRSRGVFATVLNSFSSGGVVLGVFDAARTIAHSQSVAVIVLVLLSFAVYLFVWLFIKETYLIVMRRMTLEGRVYDTVPLHRFLYPIQSRRWAKMAWTMFVRCVYQYLWMLTIVGGIIKFFSYSQVPYIMAENPNLGANEAITLSRRMMKGHKWERFVAALSFLGWELLNMVTFGLSGIFYSNGYKAAFYAEYYAYLRGLAKAQGIPGSEALCDDALFAKQSAETLRQTYADMAELIDQPLAEVAKPRGFVGFLSQWLGIQLRFSTAVTSYEEYSTRMHMRRKASDILEAHAYPGRFAPTPMELKRGNSTNLSASRSYTLLNLVMMFFIFCFVGWVWEVSLAFITEGMFVNRGTLHGPWLPIYGTGGVIILVLLKRLRDKPVLEFVAAMVLCGALEYFSSWYLEITHDGQRWWDYTGYFLNLNGRICAEGLLTFGLGGLTIVYVLAPALDNQLRKINTKALTVVAVLLLVVYVADQAYSAQHPNIGAGITDYKASSESVEVQPIIVPKAQLPTV